MSSGRLRTETEPIKPRQLAVYKGIRAIWGKSRLCYVNTSFFDRQNDTFYVPVFFYELGAAKMKVEVLCRINLDGQGIYNLLQINMQQLIERWMEGQRSYLGPRTKRAEQRALLGEERRLGLRNEPEPARQSYQSAATRQRWDWKWRENNPGPWAPVQEDEAEEVEP